MSKIIGIISDTHGLLREEAIEALQGSDLILHAGDIGTPEVIRTLEKIAPVVAVRGNMDRGFWADDYPLTQVAECGHRTFYILHDLKKLEIDPARAEFDVVVSGHTHRLSEEWKDGALYLNPGSAGPRRFGLPVTLLRLKVEKESMEVLPVTLI
ncbi:MAG: metallophosphoesterase family protein [Firmicutes bacterium]|jgi:putative phosphoesterase|nr:metallophosphoesterase family protein [Bacillota bacterium]